MILEDPAIRMKRNALRLFRGEAIVVGVPNSDLLREAGDAALRAQNEGLEAAALGLAEEVDYIAERMKRAETHAYLALRRAEEAENALKVARAALRKVRRKRASK